MYVRVYVYVSESGRAVVASVGDNLDHRHAPGFHHDEVTLVLLVLNSLSNYIQSYARIIPAADSYGIAPTSVYVCLCRFSFCILRIVSISELDLFCLRINFFLFLFLFRFFFCVFSHF